MYHSTLGVSVKKKKKRKKMFRGYVEFYGCGPHLNAARCEELHNRELAVRHFHVIVTEPISLFPPNLIS